MRKPKPLSLEDVPPIPDRLVGTPCSNGDLVYVDGVHRWRVNKDGKILYYIRYTEKLDRQEAAYQLRARR